MLVCLLCWVTDQGTFSFAFTPTQLMTIGRQSTAFAEILQDGSVQFQAIGVPLSLTTLQPLIDMPLDIKAFHEVDLTVNYAIRSA